ncbi:MAG: hypothetical protein ACM3QZ_01290 [Solirubrobacterales bacterium]
MTKMTHTRSRAYQTMLYRGTGIGYSENAYGGIHTAKSDADHPNLIGGRISEQKLTTGEPAFDAGIHQCNDQTTESFRDVRILILHGIDSASGPIDETS